MSKEYYEDMLEQHAINKYLNMVANDYNGELAKIFEKKYINKDKENERLNNIIKEVREYIKDHAYWKEETEDGNFISGKLLNEDDITYIEEILDKGK